jgi:glycosyltransferase involved in cell wall biosynthesis
MSDRDAPSPAPGGTPDVAVVLPVRNAVSTIEAALRSILDQDYSGRLEVVVADAMSDDGTREVVAAAGAADSRVRMVDNPRRSTPAGLNAAIAASTGAVVVRCDAHAELPPGYVARAVATLQRTGADNVGGVQQAEGVGFAQRAVAFAMSSPIGVGDARFHYGGAPGPVDTVYLGTFRRAALDRIGGFGETLLRNQDYELNHRIRRSGGVVYFDPELRVRYRPRRGLGSLWRQYWQYGAWKRHVVRLHPRSLRLRQLAAPAFVLGLAGSVALAATGHGVAALVVPVAYLALLAGATVVEALRRRDPAVLLFPAAVATMHLAWGTGFLVGRAGRP